MQPVDIGDESRVSRTTPAPLDSRVGAAVVDTLAVILLTGLLIFIPLKLTGVMTPVFALSAAVLIWNIAPLWVFRQTLGFRLFGIEMVTKTGHSAELTELLFREMIGRGFLPAMFLLSVGVGAFAVLTGRGQLLAVGNGLGLAVLLAFFFVGLAVIGNFVVFIREDRRSLADILAKTMVIPARWLPLPTDEDDRLALEQDRARKIRGYVIFCVVTTAIALVLPWAITRRPGPKDNTNIEARLARQKLELKVQNDPLDEYAMYQLAAAYRSDGDEQKAKDVEAKHAAAVKKRDADRETSLKNQLAANPDDEEAVDDLIGLYHSTGRLTEAKAVYASWVDKHPTPDELAGYGTWLYQNDFNEEAVTRLQAAIKAGDKDAETQAYLGFALSELGKKDEARKALKAALKLDPELDSVKDELDRLNGK
ncbi:MAG: RDD family protein [Myxococcaceae bacterium]